MRTIVQFDGFLDEWWERWDGSVSGTIVRIFLYIHSDSKIILPFMTELRKAELASESGMISCIPLLFWGACSI